MSTADYIENLIVKAQTMRASDIHFVCGLCPKIRVDGVLVDLDDHPLTEQECKEFAVYLSNENDFDCEYDGAMTIRGIRIRIHIFLKQGVPSAALRILRENIPDASTLGLPPKALSLTEKRKGIILVTGETGSGKSTTLAGLIQSINNTRACHIVTLEDPIEYVYKPNKAVINQREVGKDTKSFAEGLRASLREDPDVILIGEMRDKETIETAITAAETGHLVFGTLHTGSASDSIDRMVQVFPGDMQAQIRLQLSMCLEAVLTQQLVPLKNGGRTLAVEFMIVTDGIRNLIRTGNTPQIANTVATSVAIGGQTMDQALLKLFKEGKITRETAVSFAHDKEFVKKAAF